MTTPSDPLLLVMHGLRLQHVATATGLAEALGVAEAEVKPMLDQLVSEDRATYRTGRISGFMLNPAGRAEHLARIAAEVDAAGVRPGVQAAYQRFLGLNTDLLTICTQWQLREINGQSVPNDHADGAYDATVIERLADLDGLAQPIAADLAALLARFAPYGPRLAFALAGVHAGEVDLFTRPMVPSYHTVWFEWHEDLLVTLGIERGSEGAD